MSHGHSANAQQMQIRREVRDVPCPKCGAAAGEKCLGKTYADGSRYVRAASHAARWAVYRDLKKDTMTDAEVFADRLAQM